MGLKESVRRALAEARERSAAADAPDWEPLERVLPAEHCAGFVWMGLAPGGIRLYKHGLTRRYLNLYPRSGRRGARLPLQRQGLCPHPASGGDRRGVYGHRDAGRRLPERPARDTLDQEYRALRDRKLCERGWTVIADACQPGKRFQR